MNNREIINNLNIGNVTISKISCSRISVKTEITNMIVKSSAGISSSAKPTFLYTKKIESTVNNSPNGYSGEIGNFTIAAFSF